MTKDAETVFAELKQIVDEVGHDFVYQGPEDARYRCLYVHGDKPGCIAGQWLVRFGGVELDTLKKWEGQQAAKVITELEVDVTRDARGVIRCAQQEQDSDETWGDALATTRSLLENGHIGAYAEYC